MCMLYVYHYNQSYMQYCTVLTVTAGDVFSVKSARLQGGLVSLAMQLAALDLFAPALPVTSSGSEFPPRNLETATSTFSKSSLWCCWNLSQALKHLRQTYWGLLELLANSSTSIARTFTNSSNLWENSSFQAANIFPDASPHNSLLS